MKSILKKNVKIIIVVATFLIVCNILSALHPFIMKQILDIDFTSNNRMEILTKLVLTYAGIHISLMFFKWFRNAIMNKATTRVLKQLREKLFCHVLDWDMTTYQKYNSSEIYTRLTADVENVSALILGTLQVLVNDILYILVMVIFMFSANFSLAIIGTVSIILMAMVSCYFTNQVAKANQEILDKRDKQNKQYSEMYNKNKLTYLFQLQQENIKEIHQTLEEEVIYRKRYIFREGFIFPVAITIQAIGIYAILCYALKGNLAISLGSIYLVINYMKECRSPLNEIFRQLEEIQSSFMSLTRINHILKEKGKENIEIDEPMEDLKGDIEFINVGMRYGKTKILNNISFYIKEGSKVTIVGKTGVGKTTLVNILMRLYPISEGKVLINGKDLSKIRIKDIRKNISYISQTPYILEDTLKNNITLGDEKITNKEIEKVATEIGFETVLENFKDGLEEKINKARLSYGQLQMIAFLRAILHKANIYIFDEPTSNIDLQTEDRIQKLINKISETSTVIIIAHRKSTIESSDKIIYLKEGKVDLIKNLV